MKEKRKYRCHWCFTEFEQEVAQGYSGGRGNEKMEKKGCVSDQVKCPKCDNGLKTWE